VATARCHGGNRQSRLFAPNFKKPREAGCGTPRCDLICALRSDDTEANNTYKNSVDQTGALAEIQGISTDCFIPSAGIDIRATISAGGFDVVSFSRNIR
jgi:hypothetical protein